MFNTVPAAAAAAAAAAPTPAPVLQQQSSRSPVAAAAQPQQATLRDQLSQGERFVHETIAKTFRVVLGTAEKAGGKLTWLPHAS